jgi:hypothetical protein
MWVAWLIDFFEEREKAMCQMLDAYINGQHLHTLLT